MADPDDGGRGVLPDGGDAVLAPGGCPAGVRGRRPVVVAGGRRGVRRGHSDVDGGAADYPESAGGGKIGRMNARLRASGLGAAAVAAVAVTVLSAPAAAADECAPPGTQAVTQREVAAKVGSLPIGATAQVAVPAWVLQPAPERL